MFNVGTRYLHVRLGLECTVTAYYGDQHRVDVVMDDGREFQGVPFDLLQDLPKAPKPVVAPPPPPPPPPVEEPVADVPTSDEDEDIPPPPPPSYRRGR